MPQAPSLRFFYCPGRGEGVNQGQSSMVPVETKPAVNRNGALKMFSYEIDRLVFMEQHRDRLRLAEQLRLVRQVRQQTVVIAPLHRRIVSWVGAQMVKAGTGLQGGAAPIGRLPSG